MTDPNPAVRAVADLIEMSIVDAEDAGMPRDQFDRPLRAHLDRQEGRKA
jgi:hypothetical protein